MWEMMERMASDRLWIYTSIAGSIAGAACLAYLSTTRVGLWGYGKFDQIVDFLVERWGSDLAGTARRCLEKTISKDHRKD
jgi:hypothetical protein